jgi:hypothetical protein
LRLPIAAVPVDPQPGLKDGAGVEPAAADPAGALLRDETGAHQNLDMARHRLQRNLERRRQLGDEQIFAIQSVEYRAANRIGERAEHQIEGRVVGFRNIHAADLISAATSINYFVDDRRRWHAGVPLG